MAEGNRRETGLPTMFPDQGIFQSGCQFSGLLLWPRCAPAIRLFIIRLSAIPRRLSLIGNWKGRGDEHGHGVRFHQFPPGIDADVNRRTGEANLLLYIPDIEMYQRIIRWVIYIRSAPSLDNKSSLDYPECSIRCIAVDTARKIHASLRSVVFTSTLTTHIVTMHLRQRRKRIFIIFCRWLSSSRSPPLCLPLFLDHMATWSTEWVIPC